MGNKNSPTGSGLELPDLDDNLPFIDGYYGKETVSVLPDIDGLSADDSEGVNPGNDFIPYQTPVEKKDLSSMFSTEQPLGDSPERYEDTVEDDNNLPDSLNSSYERALAEADPISDGESPNHLNLAGTEVYGFSRGSSLDYEALPFEEKILFSFNIDTILFDAASLGASDIHIKSGELVAFTILGDIAKQPQYGRVTDDIAEAILKARIKDGYEKDLVTNQELDGAYVIKDGPGEGTRFRLASGYSNRIPWFTFRHIPGAIPTPEKLGVPSILKEWLRFSNGLVLVCGTTGTGKTTTLASCLREIQLTQPKNIYTVEKPVEFIYPDDGLGFVRQREVAGISDNSFSISNSADTRSFSSALDTAMRSAPDIILIGETRNRVEADQLLRAAESGHLTVSTMHTNSAPATLNRIKSLFEGSEQARVLDTLSEVVKGFMNQVLVLSPDGTKRVAVHETLDFNSELKELIQAGDIHSVRKYQEEMGATMNHELARAFLNGITTLDSAREKSPDVREFDLILKKMDS